MAYKWLARYEGEGEAGLEDRSCRPHRLRRKTPRRLVERMVRLRRRKKAAWEISAETGVAAFSSTRETLASTEAEAIGVNSDAELQALIQIEQAYAANVQVIQTASRMLDQLLEI